jgi:hypothetical protein
MDVLDVSGSIAIAARVPRVVGGDATAVVIRRSQNQKSTKESEGNATAGTKL